MDVATPRPVVATPPRGQKRPIVVEVPHAGTAVPPPLRGEVALDDAGIRGDADLYVDRLYRRAPEFGATLVTTEISRFIIDLNRATDDVDLQSVAEHPAPRRDAPRGLIWRVATDGTVALRAPLALAAYRNRIASFYEPYHAALARIVAELKEQFGHVVVLSGHSMPSVGKATHADPGRRRADVVPGDLRGATCSPRITQEAIDLFARAGYRVAPNDPYQGGETTRRYGRPPERIHALQVELNRAIYMDEGTLLPREGQFERVSALCDQLVDRLASLDAAGR